MKREAARNYAVNAFRIYTALGRVKVNRLLEENDPLQSPIIYDLWAVGEMLDRLKEEKDGTLILKAVKYVYFRSGIYSFDRGEISSRVAEICRALYVSETQVYRYLRTARDLFCKIRGLCTAEDELLILQKHIRP